MGGDGARVREEEGRDVSGSSADTGDDAFVGGLIWLVLSFTFPDASAGDS